MTEPLTPYQQATLHQDRGPTVIAVVSFFIGLTTIAVALRLASRLTRRVKLGPDDWFACAGLIFTHGYIVTVILAVQRGQGKHVWAVDPAGSWKVLQVGYINSIINPLARGSIKLSLLFLYRRVFTMNITWFRYTWWALLFYSVSHDTAGLFGGAFQCTPASYFWQRVNPALNPPAKGFCTVNTAALVTASSSLTIVGEVALFIVPLIMLLQLQLRRRQKIGLMLVFGSGALAIAAESVRLHFTFAARQIGADTTWITTDLYLWAAIENSIGLLCACMPTFGPILGRAKHALSSYFSNESLQKFSNSFRGETFGASRWPMPSSMKRKAATNRDRSMATLESTNSSDQQGILRTDEVYVDEYTKSDDVPLHNYYDVTKPVTHGPSII
ncbi:hypothetical protein GGR57DRAFT_290012 [Xylariaceae sp. FL1272]|nr:hypothetical protein GGR57DRAFT_290012 [Xylariaceae sp. FL1272]